MEWDVHQNSAILNWLGRYHSTSQPIVCERELNMFDLGCTESLGTSRVEMGTKECALVLQFKLLPPG